MNITARRDGSPAAGNRTPHAPPARAARAQGDLSVVLGRLPFVGLLVVQAAIGYEWLMSGLTKIARGGFPAGLAAELREKSVGAPGWYRTVIDDVLIPNGQTVGYLTEIGELLVGLVLIGAAAAFIFAPDRLSRVTVEALFGLTALSAFLALVMNVNFHLANGSPHPWLIPASGFDEGVDLDSLMPFIEITLIVVSLLAVRRLRALPGAGSRTAAYETR